MKKTLKVYYKGVCQNLKYYGDIEIDNIKETLREIFSIKENPNQMYFQDEDGDIIILNKNIPSDLSVFLYVKPDSIPKNPEHALEINRNVSENYNSSKFHWIIDPNGDTDHKNTNLENKYIYRNNSNDGHSLGNIRSSISFKTGVSFFVIRVSNFPHYSFLKVVDENKKVEFGKEYDINYTNIGLGATRSLDYVEPHKVYNIGVLINMINKFCIFYDYDKQQKLKCIKDSYTIYTRRDDKPASINIVKGEPLEGKILSDNVKLVAWIKNDAYKENSGMTILNEGCIPIPEWVKI